MSVPLNIFLFYEILRMKKVLDICRTCFTNVILAIEGQITMTLDISEAINNIFDVRVPEIFLKDPSGAEISWLLPTLGSWFTSL